MQAGSARTLPFIIQSHAYERIADSATVHTLSVFARSLPLDVTGRTRPRVRLLAESNTGSVRRRTTNARFDE